MTKKSDSPKKVVVKSNRLIEAKSRLSIQEQRILLTAIAQIKPTEMEFNEKGYPISISDFRDMADLKGRSYYTEIRKLTAKLVGRTIVIHEEDGILQTTWLSSAKYKDQQGVVYLNFDPRLKPYLIQLKKEFTSYQLHYVMKLKSKYSTRVYELLKQYEKIGKREFDLDDFKQIVVAEEGKYGNFGDLNRNVLKKAEKEINSCTDLRIKYSTIKTGRKVVGLKFTIIPNQPNIDAAKKEIDLIKMVEPLMELLPTDLQTDHKMRDLIRKWVMDESEDYVKWNVLYVNSKNYKDYKKYFRKALSENYGKNYQLQLFEEKEKKALQQEKEKQEADEREKILKENYAWEEEMRKKIDGLSDVQRDMLYEMAADNYAKIRKKNPKTVNRDSYGVFMEAAKLFDDFLENEILIAN